MLTLDSISPLEKIKLSGALAKAATTLKNTSSPLGRVKAARDVAELLKRLTGAAAAVQAKIKFSLSDKSGSARFLSEYLQSGLEDLPHPLRVMEARTVAELAGAIDSDDVANLARPIRMDYTDGEDALHLAAFTEIASRGVKVDIDLEAQKERHEQAAQILKETATNDPEQQRIGAAINDLNTKFTAQRNILQEKIRAEMSARRAGKGTSELEDSLISQLEGEYAAYKKSWNQLNRESQAALAAFRASKEERANTLFAEDGGKVVDAVLRASPISHDDAQAWAAKQVVDKKALTKLKKIGYSEEQLYLDIAEFYRISGGKASTIRISSDGGRRANAVGVEALKGEKIINIGAHFSKTTLFHELAHHLENDPIAKAASNGFLVKRRDGARAHSLRSLTGNRGYGPREIAYKDEFMNPYIGKIYRDGVTEVFAMGVQYLANPKDAAMFAAKDPEMFAMITGYLASKLTPAMEAKLHMHEGAVGDLLEQRETDAQLFEKSLDALAAEVKITPDNKWEEAQGTPEAKILDYVLGRGPKKYVGSFGKYLVFEGSFRNRNTSRKGKGHVVAILTGSSMDSSAVHGGLRNVRAFIALAERTNEKLNRLFYTFFMTGPNQIKNLIKAAGIEDVK